MFTQRDFLRIADERELSERKLSCFCYDCIDSTNSEARRYAEQTGKGNVLFLADRQSAGRGRTGKSFYSPQGTGVYLTLLLDITDDAPASVVALTSASAVAAAEACDSVCGTKCGIKWVNDLYIDGKKVCGILAESFEAHGRRFVAIGVGINLSTDSFPTDIADIAGSLANTAGADMRRELAIAVCTGVFDIYNKLRAGDFSYMQSYRERSLVLGKEIKFWQNGAENSGTCVSIKDSGALEVRLPDGHKALLASGEISLRVK